MLGLTAVAVAALDLAVKALLRSGRLAAVQLGPFGMLRVVPGRLWIHRSGERRGNALWLWFILAAALVAGSVLLPSIDVFAGLVLGGSLGNAVESAWRGLVTDYVCLRWWPAFNLGDAALTIGAAGIAIELAHVLASTAGTQ